MERRGLSQSALARAAGVSQATVWRALNGTSERRGAARARLFSYAGIGEWVSSEEKRGPSERVMAAFYRVWDHSETHAEAIVRVIDATSGLAPRGQNRKGR